MTVASGGATRGSAFLGLAALVEAEDRFGFLAGYDVGEVAVMLLAAMRALEVAYGRLFPGEGLAGALRQLGVDDIVLNGDDR